MARPTNTDERRQQIARGLQRVMAKKGYDGASIADIAKAAGLSSGLVHYHFEDKLEILVALAGQLAEDAELALNERLAQVPDDPAAAVSAVIDLHLGLGASARTEVLACWIALSGEALRHRAVREVFEQTLGMVRRVVSERIEAGIRKKVFKSRVDADAAAAGLVAAIQGYFVLAGTARALIPIGSAALTVKAMMGGVLGVSL